MISDGLFGLYPVLLQESANFVIKYFLWISWRTYQIKRVEEIVFLEEMREDWV